MQPLAVEGEIAPPAYLLADRSGQLHTSRSDRDRPDLGLAVRDVRDIIEYPQIVISGATWPVDLIYRARLHNPLAVIRNHLRREPYALAIPYPDDWPDEKVERLHDLVAGSGVRVESVPESVALAGYMRGAGLVHDDAPGATVVYSDSRSILVVAAQRDPNEPTESIDVPFSPEALENAKVADDVVWAALAGARTIGSDSRLVLLAGNIVYNDHLRMAFQNHLGNRMRIAEHPLHAVALGAAYLISEDGDEDDGEPAPAAAVVAPEPEPEPEPQPEPEPDPIEAEAEPADDASSPDDKPAEPVPEPEPEPEPEPAIEEPKVPAPTPVENRQPQAPRTAPPRTAPTRRVDPPQRSNLPPTARPLTTGPDSDRGTADAQTHVAPAEDADESVENKSRFAALQWAWVVAFAIPAIALLVAALSIGRWLAGPTPISEDEARNMALQAIPADDAFPGLKVLADPNGNGLPAVTARSAMTSMACGSIPLTPQEADGVRASATREYRAPGGAPGPVAPTTGAQRNDVVAGDSIALRSMAYDPETTDKVLAAVLQRVQECPNREENDIRYVVPVPSSGDDPGPPIQLGTVVPSGKPDLDARGENRIAWRGLLPIKDSQIGKVEQVTCLVDRVDDRMLRSCGTSLESRRADALAESGMSAMHDKLAS